MTSPERIVLPRSGVVLTRAPNGSYRYPARYVDHEMFLVVGTDSAWYEITLDRLNESDDGTLAECVAWLDAAVMRERAKLLPPGGFVVTDDEATVDAIIAALRGRGMAADEADARAVLSALRGGGK